VLIFILGNIFFTQSVWYSSRAR